MRFPLFSGAPNHAPERLIPEFGHLIPRFGRLILTSGRAIPTFGRVIRAFRHIIPALGRLIPAFGRLIHVHRHSKSDPRPSAKSAAKPLHFLLLTRPEQRLGSA